MPGPYQHLVHAHKALKDDDLIGEDIPEPSEYLRSKQKDGKPLGADALFKETWCWLRDRGCEK
ncbi:MAG: hypothetical protein GX236_02300, partial [Clostridiaceae bacterium]|nr:hypothetical protein [Clostridiaceae bacterium]